MDLITGRKTPAIKIGNIYIGSKHPVAIQSMTNTPTADIEKTINQITELIGSGSDMVRLTINDEIAASSTVKIIKKLRKKNYTTPIIGDFHFNGHILLNKNTECAKLLDKYRINPGNIGAGKKHDDNFSAFIKIAIKNKKPVRIGVNWGSLDREVLKSLLDKNSKKKNHKEVKHIICDAMMQSALQSAHEAEKIGLNKNKIVLSVKMSDVQNTINVYSKLAKKCNYALHLGLTEAGSDIYGITSSVCALSVLLQQGIGDTIRISLTPKKGIKRTQEVEVCKALLQSLGLRFFRPTVTSCPGCGRTNSNFFQILAEDVNCYIDKNLNIWKRKYHGIEKLKVAVMGCVVNGPGESKHADIGISIPGSYENFSVPIYIEGKKYKTLSGKNIKTEFIKILNSYIRKKFSK